MRKISLLLVLMALSSLMFAHESEITDSTGKHWLDYSGTLDGTMYVQAAEIFETQLKSNFTNVSIAQPSSLEVDVMFKMVKSFDLCTGDSFVYFHMTDSAIKTIMFIVTKATEGKLQTYAYKTWVVR